MLQKLIVIGEAAASTVGGFPVTNTRQWSGPTLSPFATSWCMPISVLTGRSFGSRQKMTSPHCARIFRQCWDGLTPHNLIHRYAKIAMAAADLASSQTTLNTNDCNSLPPGWVWTTICEIANTTRKTSQSSRVPGTAVCRHGACGSSYNAGTGDCAGRPNAQQC